MPRSCDITAAVIADVLTAGCVPISAVHVRDELCDFPAPWRVLSLSPVSHIQTV